MVTPKPEEVFVGEHYAWGEPGTKDWCIVEVVRLEVVNDDTMLVGARILHGGTPHTRERIRWHEETQFLEMVTRPLKHLDMVTRRLEQKNRTN